MDPPRCDSVSGRLPSSDGDRTIERGATASQPQERMHLTPPRRDCHGDRSGSFLVAKKVAVAKTSVQRPSALGPGREITDLIGGHRPPRFSGGNTPRRASPRNVRVHVRTPYALIVPRSPAGEW